MSWERCFERWFHRVVQASSRLALMRVAQTEPVDANDVLDARAWARDRRSRLTRKAPSQRVVRADRFTQKTLDLLQAGDVDEAMLRLDTLVETLHDDEEGLDALGAGLVETIFELGLHSEAVVRAFEARSRRAGWHSVLLSAWPAWGPDRLALPSIDREARALIAGSATAPQ